jgi:hypothetical protein
VRVTREFTRRRSARSTSRASNSVYGSRKGTVTPRSSGGGGVLALHHRRVRQYILARNSQLR